MTTADRQHVVRTSATAGVVAMAVAAAYVVISLVLILGFGLPRIPTLVVGGGVLCVVVVSTSIALGISSRKSLQK
jgi:hypothetical protein